jgi:TusA-related sulfurtransferase
MTEVLDARGLSCPQPAMLTRQALQKLGKGTLEVLVDSPTARENISRLAREASWKVEIQQQADGSVKLILSK